MSNLVIGIILLALSPLAVLVLQGLDRRVSARMQSRMGPPLAQPFYDMIKLYYKDTLSATAWQSFLGWSYFVSAAGALLLFFSGGDLLLVFFTQAAASAFLVMAAFSSTSPYSRIGANRELMSILAYEPILLLTIIAMYLHAGTFKVSGIMALDYPLLPKLPLVFIALTLALTIKLKKSPFDISSSHHAHQEIVRGLYTEFSGRSLFLVELGHVLEVALVLGMIALFWGVSPIGMAILILGSWFVEVLVDNTTARLTFKKMIAAGWGWGLAMCVANLIWAAAF